MYALCELNKSLRKFCIHIQDVASCKNRSGAEVEVIGLGDSGSQVFNLPILVVLADDSIRDATLPRGTSWGTTKLVAASAFSERTVSESDWYLSSGSGT